MEKALPVAIAAIGVFLSCSEKATAQFVNSPTARWGHCIVFDTARGKAVLWGGRETTGSQSFSNETWEWDGAAWERIPTNTSPPAQAYGAMVYDSARSVSLFYGNGETWEYDGVDWQRFNGPSPSARFHHAMAYDSARGRTVMFGGSVVPSQGDALAETWEFDGTQWFQRSASSPPARSHHAMAYHVGTARTVLFGGQPPLNNGNIFLSDMWTWDGSNWSQRSPAVRPPARTTHGMTYHAGLDRIFLTGGWSGTAPGDADTWSWDGFNWTQINSAIPPFRRAWTGHQFVYDNQRNEMLLFGGCGPYPEIPDTWTFDGQDWTPKLGFVRQPGTRSLIATTPALPVAAAESLATQAGAGLVTVRRQSEQDWIWSNYGGRDLWIGLNDRTSEGTYEWASGEPVTYTNWAPGRPSGGTSRNVVAMRSSSAGAWADETGTASYVAVLEKDVPGAGGYEEIYPSLLTTSQGPPPLDDPAIAPLPNGGALFFGGINADGPSYPTYELHGSVWSQTYSIVNPLPRVRHAIARDARRANNLMFGGVDHAGTVLDDTWTYRDGTWTFRGVQNRPSARTDHSLSWDPNLGVCILFGGKDASGATLGDMWRWNGSAWTRLTPSVLPPARHSHQIALDPRRGRLVLFGGERDGVLLNDGWEWDGAAWTEITPAQPNWRPDPLADFGMDYDPRSERIVLFGGNTSSGCSAEFWSWDGSQWVLSYSDGAMPSARHGHHMFFDVAQNELRLYGGGCGGSSTDELWKIDLPVQHRYSQFGVGCQGTVGVPALAADPTTQPVLGQPFKVDLTGIPGSPANIPFIIIGFSKTEWAGGALPLDLGIIGMPGCQLLTSSEEVRTVANLAGRASISFVIPQQTTLLGVSTFLQGAVTDRFANLQGLIVSNGVEIFIGDR